MLETCKNLGQIDRTLWLKPGFKLVSQPMDGQSLIFKLLPQGGHMYVYRSGGRLLAIWEGDVAFFGGLFGDIAAGYHPVQIYELAGDLGIAALLIRLGGRLPAGSGFLKYLVQFRNPRFALFFMRGDVARAGFALTEGTGPHWPF